MWAVAASMYDAYALCGLLHPLRRLLQPLCGLSQAPRGMLQPLCMLHMRYVGFYILYVGHYSLYALCTGVIWAVTASNPSPNHKKVLNIGPETLTLLQ